MTRITIRVGDFPEYLRKNPGAIPILVFVITLIVVAVIYPYNRALADELITNAFYFLVVGVILQAIACARSKKSNTTGKVYCSETENLLMKKPCRISVPS